MADELELDDINRTEKRIKDLSSTVKTTSEERDAANAAKEAAEAARLAAEKERDFFKGFSEVSTKYQGASEHQDKIWDKVKNGYTVEDATVAVMNSEGKLVPPPPAPLAPAAGGSAPMPSLELSQKPLEEMSREDKRATLMGLEKKGDIYLS